VTVSEIGFLGLALILGGGAWYRILEARERANAAVANTCRQAGLQLLDGTVALGGLRITRDNHGRLVLERTYNFDYSSDGYSRKQGFVILRRGQVHSMGLAPEDGPGQGLY
jgi:hypothetical protein